jgi:transposase-like protein
VCPEIRAKEGRNFRWYNQAVKTSSSNNPNGRKRYTPQFKAQLVQQILREEKSIAQLAAEHGIHPNQLHQWRDQALQALPSLFSDQSAREQAAKDAAHYARFRPEYELAADGGLANAFSIAPPGQDFTVHVRGVTHRKV